MVMKHIAEWERREAWKEWKSVIFSRKNKRKQKEVESTVGFLFLSLSLFLSQKSVMHLQG